MASRDIKKATSDVGLDGLDGIFAKLFDNNNARVSYDDNAAYTERMPGGQFARGDVFEHPKVIELLSQLQEKYNDEDIRTDISADEDDGQHQGIKEICINHLQTFALDAIVNNRPTIFFGPYGIGKTSVLSNLAENLSKLTGEAVEFVSLAIASAEVSDIKGIPAVVKNEQATDAENAYKAQYYSISNILPDPEKYKGKSLIIYIDEFNLPKDPVVLDLLREFIRNGEIPGLYDLKKAGVNYRILMSANAPMHGAENVVDIPLAILAGRANIHYLRLPETNKEMRVYLDSICHEMTKAGKLPIHPVVYGYLVNNPILTPASQSKTQKAVKKIYYTTDVNPDAPTARVTPRTWHAVSDHLYKVQRRKTVGEFKEYLNSDYFHSFLMGALGSNAHVRDFCNFIYYADRLVYGEEIWQMTNEQFEAALQKGRNGEIDEEDKEPLFITKMNCLNGKASGMELGLMFMQIKVLTQYLEDLQKTMETNFKIIEKQPVDKYGIEYLKSKYVNKYLETVDRIFTYAKTIDNNEIKYLMGWATYTFFINTRNPAFVKQLDNENRAKVLEMHKKLIAELSSLDQGVDYENIKGYLGNDFADPNALNQSPSMGM